MRTIPVAWRSHIVDSDYLLALLNPGFLRKEGLIVLRAHYDPKTFKKNWMPFIRKHGNDSARMENTINHVHLGDITSNLRLQRQIGERLIKIWRSGLRSKYPSYRFELKLERTTEWELQLWTMRHPPSATGKKK